MTCTTNCFGIIPVFVLTTSPGGDKGIFLIADPYDENGEGLVLDVLAENTM